MTRQEALARLRSQIEAGRPIIGAGSGTGLSAKCAEAGGADLIIIYNSDRYRMAGRGSLAGCMPYGDANAIVVGMAAEVLPVIEHTPVHGARTSITLDEAVERVQAMCDAATEVNPRLIVLCHGGPIAEPVDAAYVLERTTDVVGFFGASSVERLATEIAITENMRRFKAIPLSQKEKVN